MIGPLTYNNMNYGISSRDYLERAKKCLSLETHEALYYAAFEIRCGVEARLQEYLEVQEHISKKKREGWQVAKLERSIENVFKTGDKTAILQIFKDDQIKFEARYTPVKSSLRNTVKKLGNYLHNAKKLYKSDDVFWNHFRDLLQKAVLDLEQANSGRLLGPVLIHPNKKNINVKLSLPTPEEQKIAKRLFLAGDSVTMKIEYE